MRRLAIRLNPKRGNEIRLDLVSREEEEEGRVHARLLIGETVDGFYIRVASNDGPITISPEVSNSIRIDG